MARVIPCLLIVLTLLPDQDGKTLDLKALLYESRLNFHTAITNCVTHARVVNFPNHSLTNRPLVYLALGATGAGLENLVASNLGLITTFSMVTFSGGTGVSLTPSAVLATGRTLVSKRNGISRPLTFR